jgi:hypothetical protein
MKLPNIALYGAFRDDAIEWREFVHGMRVRDPEGLGLLETYLLKCGREITSENLWGILPLIPLEEAYRQMAGDFEGRIIVAPGGEPILMPIAFEGWERTSLDWGGTIDPIDVVLLWCCDPKERPFLENLAQFPHPIPRKFFLPPKLLASWLGMQKRPCPGLRERVAYLFHFTDNLLLDVGPSEGWELIEYDHWDWFRAGELLRIELEARRIAGKTCVLNGKAPPLEQVIDWLKRCPHRILTGKD